VLCGERAEYGAPELPGVREAVQQEHGRAVAGERDVYLDAVGRNAAKFGLRGRAGGVRGRSVAGGRDGWHVDLHGYHWLRQDRR
jgi:hypothetical protein